MANITKRVSKSGQVSYRIRVYAGEDVNGKQLYQSMTWTPPPTMRPTTAEKEAKRQALLFEEKVRQGLLSFDGKTRFADYANSWLENEPLAYKTRARYKELMQRIAPAIGHIKLENLQAKHLESFYKSLAEPGVKNKGQYAVSEKLNDIMGERKLSRGALGKLADIAPSTVSSAAQGKRVSIEKAQAIADVLGADIDTIFTVVKDTEGLSPRTIRHHHQFISAVLAKAKKERIIPFNVAAEHTTSPKVPRTEAEYLNDEEAQRFLALLLQEEDIRIKTALVLLLVTGVRRGELCGLSWPDCDIQGGTIYVRRASQYQVGKGAVEVSTKNDSSRRAIDIPVFTRELLEAYRVWWMEHRLLWGQDWQGTEQRLFVQDDGKPINPDTINFWMNKFLEKHDFPHITPHSLRHTFATLQITAGVDMRTLQSRTGHAQASTLINTYSHAVKSAQKKATDALEAVLLPDAKNV
ncbi:tyrosine-type recombinase/integrase [Ruminococcaceae bacterium OttesenSCG-928-O06]|nr:tyrosine-type recombinase/integrase [Ruminococcaceae bacterium OttesenSCG-928-O06]